jgi:flagellar basal-body rod modification protein FlgD
LSIDTSYAQGSNVPVGGSGSSGASEPVDRTSLDKQAFLKLLVAQMRYQDPTSPMDTTQRMAQTTQLNTMERLVELSDTQREAFALQMRSSAAALVGREVTWKDSETTTRTGVVTAVSYAGAVPTVRVGDIDVPLDAVAAVTAVTPSTTTPPTTPAA